MPLELGDFSAWIEVDGVELPQHGVEYSQDEKTATCWIASEDGKTFSVHWNSKFPHTALGLVTIDGIKYSGAFTHPPQGQNRSTACYKSVRTTPTLERPLVFSTLELTDDDAYLNHSTSPDLGDIKLDITKVQLTDRRTPLSGLHYTDPGKIHERSKKAIGHRAQLGDGIPCAPTQGTGYTDLGQIETFIFKYRPLEQLQANGIVPLDKGLKRTAASQDANSDVIDLTLEDEDADELEEREIQALRKELLAREEKRGLRVKRIKAEVKSEVKAEPLWRGFGSGDVIDLT